MPIDYKKYPKDWKTRIVPAVIERAKGKCEWCDLANKQIVYSITLMVRDDRFYKARSIWFRDYRDAFREAGLCHQEYESEQEKEMIISNKIKTVRVVLTIAHLDHDELNHDVQLDRLRALCQLCHLRYDAAEKYRRSNQSETLFP